MTADPEPDAKQPHHKADAAPTKNHLPSTIEATGRDDATKDSDHTAAAAAEPALRTSLFERGSPAAADQPGRKATASVLPIRDRDRYDFGAEHARGGLGKITIAHDRELDRQVAVKELLRQTNTTQARFVREAMITARLEHPAIVPVHEAGRWASSEPFYAMKLVSGRSLADLLKDTTTLKERLGLLPNVIAVADAIAYAHSELVIHRDLKPSNVMVGEYGETVVIDWGLAKDLNLPDEAYALHTTANLTAEDDGLTVVGTVIGTPAYMPPEQAEGLPVDERADVYSIGAILYHLLTGHAPYEAASRDKVLTLVQGADLAPVKEHSPSAPDDLIAIVDKAMAAKPIDRYSSGTKLAADLRRYQAGKLVGARDYQAAELAWRWIALHRAVVATTLFFVLIAIAGTTWFVIREQGLRTAAQSDKTRAEESREKEKSERLRAQQQTLAAIEQQAHAELEAKRPFRAAVVFHEAYRRGRDSFALRLGLGLAMRHVDGLQRILRAHSGLLHSARYSPDGSRVVTASGGGTAAQIWDADSGELLVTLRGHKGRVWAATYDPTGSRVVTASHDHTAAIWDASTGELLQTIAGHNGMVDDARFSPTGNQVVTASIDGFTRIWNAQTGQLIHELPTAEHRAASVAYSSTPSEATSGCSSGRASARTVA